jgi:hypothetical protein
MSRLCCLLLLVFGAACAGPAPQSSQPASAPTVQREAPAAVGEPSPSVAPPPATHVTVAYPNRVVSMTGFYVAIQEGYTQGSTPRWSRCWGRRARRR